MTDEAKPEIQGRTTRVQDEAMAASSPDFNLMMAKIGRYLLRPMDGSGFGAIFGTFTRTVSGMWIISLLIFFVVGLPAVNGATIFFQTLDAGDAKDKEFQLKMFELQTDLEIKKLDRTMIGQGAMKTLDQISAKLDEQGAAMAQQGQAIDRISADVAGLTRRQNSLAVQQDQLRQQVAPKR